MKRINYKKSYVADGFTLVELLVVISIIALLLSIMMPSLQKAKENAKAVVCKTNLKQMHMAAVLYGEDNGGIIPPHFFASGGQADDHHIWSSIIASYIGGSKKATQGAKGGLWAEKGEGTLKIFKCPSQKDVFYPINYYIRYGINASNTSFYDATYTSLKQLKWMNIPQPQSRLYITDSMDARPSYVKIDDTINRFRAIGTFGYMGEYVLPYEDRRAGVIWLVSDRHKGGSNALFLDGRVESKKYKELMYQVSDTAGERSQKEKMWDYRN